MPKSAMFRAAIVLSGAWMTCACTPSTPAQPEPKNEVAIQTPALPPPVPAAPAAKAFAIKDDSDLLEFAYGYPAPAAAVPDIVSRLTKDMESNKAAALKAAGEDQASARKSGFPFHAHGYQTQWTVKAETPRLLGLLAESYFYTGGAHGMTGYKTLLWDVIKKRELAVDGLITSREALAKAITPKFCEALNDARSEKRGAPVTSSNGEFDRCVDPLKQTIVPVSNSGKAIDQLLVVIGPYEAGPYSEGSYEIPLPIDKAMLAAIKPDWRGAFSVQ